MLQLPWLSLHSRERYPKHLQMLTLYWHPVPHLLLYRLLLLMCLHTLHHKYPTVLLHNLHGRIFLLQGSWFPCSANPVKWYFLWKRQEQLYPDCQEKEYRLHNPHSPKHMQWLLCCRWPRLHRFRFQKKSLQLHRYQTSVIWYQDSSFPDRFLRWFRK